MFLFSTTGRPSPPQNLTPTNVTKSSAVLTWEKPESDGGSKVTGYVIEKADAARRVYAVVGETDAHTMTYTVDGLFEGSEYLFAVRAVNKLGESEQAMTEEPVKAKLPFGSDLMKFNKISRLNFVIKP